MPTVNSVALELITEQGESTDDTDLVSEVETYVNNALDEIALITDWNYFRTRTQFNTTIGDDTYTLPAGGREIVQLRYTDNGEPIYKWSTQEAARRSVILESSGRARFWLEDGVVTSGSDILYQFRLSPVPDSVIEIEAEYIYHPSDVPSGTVLPIPSQILVPLKDRVRVYMLESVQRYDAAGRAQARFDRNVTLLVSREKRKAATESRLKFSDIQRSRRPEAIFDPAHYRNF